MTAKEYLVKHHVGILAIVVAGIASYVLHGEIQSKPYTEVKAQKEVVMPAEVAPADATPGVPFVAPSPAPKPKHT